MHSDEDESYVEETAQEDTADEEYKEETATEFDDEMEHKERLTAIKTIKRSNTPFTINEQGEKIYSCDQCQKQFKKVGKLNRHRYIHSKEVRICS